MPMIFNMNILHWKLINFIQVTFMPSTSDSEMPNILTNTEFERYSELYQSQ